jgi:hypothetical protein
MARINYHRVALWITMLWIQLCIFGQFNAHVRLHECTARRVGRLFRSDSRVLAGIPLPHYDQGTSTTNELLYD